MKRPPEYPPRAWSEEEILYALKLKAQGLSWGVVAERLQRSYGSLSVQIAHYRAGRLRFGRHRNEERRRRIAWLFEVCGVTVAELARMYQVTPQTMRQTLELEGFDTELARKARAEFHTGKRRHIPLHEWR